MEVFLLIMLFIMGTFFGSFFTLAVYRIPLKKDITHERSFCPNCNHRLEFLDLIPVFSYIFLGGKCRYCGEKIRIRYLLFEILSGIVFVIAYLSLNIKNIYLEIDKLIYFLQFVFLYVTIVITSGIDKEYRKINSSVILFGVCFQIIYILYLYVIKQTTIYRYGIYFIIFVFCYILNKKFEKKENYFFQVLLLISYILLCVEAKLIPIILIIVFLCALIQKIHKKVQLKEIRLGFFIGIFTIIFKIIENIMIFYFV